MNHVYLMENESMYQTDFQPRNVLVIAESENEAKRICNDTYGKGYECMGSVPCIKGNVLIASF